jgi:hypothetical protein
MWGVVRGDISYIATHGKLNGIKEKPAAHRED